jgi:hypothetical protein
MAVVCAATFLFGAMQSVDAQHSATQHWEYRSFIIVRPVKTGAQFTSWADVLPDGTVKELPLPVSAGIRANQLGNEGWELVSIVPMSANSCGGSTVDGDCAGFTSQIMYWFKRPKQ